MARVAIYATIPDADLDAFAGDLEASIRARLGEVFDDNADPVTLHTLGIDVEDDD
jgi:hypothetical protein